MVVAKQLTVFSRQNQLLQNRLRFDFHFCAYIGKKKKWSDGLGVFISVGLQRFCKAQFGTPLSFVTKGAK